MVCNFRENVSLNVSNSVRVKDWCGIKIVPVYFKLLFYWVLMLGSTSLILFGLLGTTSLESGYNKYS